MQCSRYVKLDVLRGGIGALAQEFFASRRTPDLRLDFGEDLRLQLDQDVACGAKRGFPHSSKPYRRGRSKE